MARIKHGMRKSVMVNGRRGAQLHIAAGGNCGLNLAVQRFRTDAGFRNGVINGHYRYSGGAFIPTGASMGAAVVVGSVPMGAVVQPTDVTQIGVYTPMHKKYGRYGPRGRYGYGYGFPRRPYHRYAPKVPGKRKSPYPHGMPKQHPIILTPGAASSGAAEELLRLIANKTFGASLKAAMDYLNVGIWDLSETSHLDDKKIGRFRNNPIRNAYREDVLALVIGLHLPPPVGIVFFEKAKIHLGYEDHEDVVYHMILGSMSTATVDEVNVELRNAGLDTIPRKIKTSVWG